VPVLNRYGAWITWIPRSGPASTPTFRDPIGFDNRTGQTVCWIDPQDPYPTSEAPPPPSLIALLNPHGILTAWHPYTGPNGIPPVEGAVPLRNRRQNTIVAWLFEPRSDRPNPRCGAL